MLIQSLGVMVYVTFITNFLWYVSVQWKSIDLVFSASNMSTGVCRPVLGTEQLLCQQFTQDKPAARVCRQFPPCVCGSGNTEQEDRREETSEQGEETAAASSSASEWLSSGFASAAALQSSHNLWVWNEHGGRIVMT